MIPLLHPAGKSFAGALPGPFTTEGQRIMLFPPRKSRGNRRNAPRRCKKMRPRATRQNMRPPHAGSLPKRTPAPAQTFNAHKQHTNTRNAMEQFTPFDRLFQSCGRIWHIRRADMDKLWAAMDQQEGEEAHLPYWNEIWPSSLALAGWLAKCRTTYAAKTASTWAAAWDLRRCSDAGSARTSPAWTMSRRRWNTPGSTPCSIRSKACASRS